MAKRIVFCGGGTRCLVFLQGLLELEQRGMLTQIHEYWGTSAGAMLASLYALTKSPKRVEEIMLATDFTKFRNVDISNLLGFQQSWGFDNGSSLVMELENIFESIEPDGKSKRMADIPSLNIVVSDLTSSETVVCNATTFPRLRVVDALRASMSLPIFFRPFHHQESGHIWVDGAIRANFPWHCLPDDAARAEAIGFTFEKKSVFKTPTTFMEYIHSMVHFDEPRKITNLRKWQNIVWFPLPPFPSWFVRFQKEDYEVVKSIGREGITNWLKEERHIQKAAYGNSACSADLSTIASLQKPCVPRHIVQQTCHRAYIDGRSDNASQDLSGCSHERISTDCPPKILVTHVPSLSSHTHTHYTPQPYRRWSV